MEGTDASWRWGLGECGSGPRVREPVPWAGQRCVGKRGVCCRVGEGPVLVRSSSYTGARRGRRWRREPKRRGREEVRAPGRRGARRAGVPSASPSLPGWRGRVCLSQPDGSALCLALSERLGSICWGGGGWQRQTEKHCAEAEARTNWECRCRVRREGRLTPAPLERDVLKEKGGPPLCLFTGSCRGRRHSRCPLTEAPGRAVQCSVFLPPRCEQGKYRSFNRTSLYCFTNSCFSLPALIVSARANLFCLFKIISSHAVSLMASLGPVHISRQCREVSASAWWLLAPGPCPSLRKL